MFFKLLGSQAAALSEASGLMKQDGLRRGGRDARAPSGAGKVMPRSIFALCHPHRIAAAAAFALLFLAAVPAEAGCSKSVVMYNASWCPYCRQVRAILARNHISYTLLDATTPRTQAVMVRRFGDTAVPRTVIGGVVVEGVDEARIKQLCR
jgi:glutaredoxin